MEVIVEIEFSEKGAVLEFLVSWQELLDMESNFELVETQIN